DAPVSGRTRRSAARPAPTTALPAPFRSPAALPGPARAGGRGGPGRRPGGPRAATGPSTALGSTAGHRLPKLAGHWGLHGRGRRLHVLAQILQLAQDLLTADAELFRELVHTGLACHCTPCISEAGGCPRSTSNLVSKHVHGAIFTTGS